MDETEIKTVIPEVTAFTQNDLPRFGQWLVERRKERWPMHSDAYHLQTVRSWMGRNDLLFVKCGDFVGLFWVTTEPVEPRSIVVEQFLWKMGEKKQHEPEGMKIYTWAKRWAISLGAKEFVGGKRSDITWGVSKGYLKADQPKEWFVSLNKPAQEKAA